MIDTVFRLFVLVPAAVVIIILGVLAIGFGGLNVPSVLLGGLLILAPLGLIWWTLADDRKRSRARNDLNA
jgi:hypothetical protein